MNSGFVPSTRLALVNLVIPLNQLLLSVDSVRIHLMLLVPDFFILDVFHYVV